MHMQRNLYHNTNFFFGSFVNRASKGVTNEKGKRTAKKSKRKEQRKDQAGGQDQHVIYAWGVHDQ